uniref:Uncharacterized protein n=1 Tax=Megaselia scalaris TaxID=36166 RepID=T1H2M8_MEGSC
MGCLYRRSVGAACGHLLQQMVPSLQSRFGQGFIIPHFLVLFLKEITLLLIFTYSHLPTITLKEVYIVLPYKY